MFNGRFKVSIQMHTYLENLTVTNIIVIYLVNSLTEEYVEDICKVLLNHRDVLSKNFSDTKMDRVKMSKLQWRINISLSLK